MRALLGLFSLSCALDVVRVPVSTDRSPSGYRDRATDEATRQQMSQLAGYVPAFVETQLGPGAPGWQAGEDLILSSESNSDPKQHGFVFLHGAGQSADDASNVDFVSQLLERMPGIAALPQALPKFNNTMWYPKTEDEDVVPGVNALVVPNYPAWASFYRPDPFPCFANKRDPRNSFWAEVEEENRARVKAYIALFIARGIPAKNIFILGFSIGAVAAQQILVDLAVTDGHVLGGGVGFDGADVDQIATKEAFARLRSPVPMLYFMYSSPPAMAQSQASCLENYHGLDLQLYRVQSDSECVPHAVYPQFLDATLQWLQASSKEEVAPAVEAAWRKGLSEIPHPILL